MAGVSAPKARRRLPDTSSRCEAESVTGTHDFVVANFSLLDGHSGILGHVSSTRFTVGGHDWILMFYPDGSNEDNSFEVTSAYLSICSGTVPPGGVKASYTLRLVDRNGDASFVGRRKTNMHTYWNATTWGFRRFFWKPLLRLSRCLHNDCLTIRCTLTVIRPLPAEDTTAGGPAAAVLPPPELPGHLERALRDGRGADVTFHVGGRVFSAHRFMLAARSPVFGAELFGPMMEKDMRRIQIADVEPAIFEMLLHYIYTESLPPCNVEGYSVAVIQHLLVAADRYGLDRLKVMCEGKLCESIDDKTVTTTLVLAEQHHCKRLKDACLAFMSSPKVLDAVLATDGFKHLMASCPLVLEENLGDSVSVEGK